MSKSTDTELNEKLTILIAEDSVTQRMRLVFTLEEAGYKVLAAENGAAGLKLAKTQPIDAIISDVVMPEMNGYDFCLEIKADPQLQHVPFLLLTTLYEPRELIRGMECGAETFIVKPFDEGNLLMRLKQLIEHPNRLESGQNKFAHNDENFEITASKEQIVRFLMATYEETSLRNQKLLRANQELQQAQNDLNVGNEELKKMNAIQNQMLGMAAHDLRNPLDVIRGYAEILLEDTPDRLDAEEIKLLKIIVGTSNFMLNLVNDLLDISKIESGTLKLTPEETSVAEFVESSVQANRIFAERKGIKIKLDYTENLPEIHLDVTRAHQVMNNILSNAVKFSHPNSVISVSMKKLDCGDVEIAIGDQGPGIDGHDLESIFQPFHQTQTGSNKAGGTGLGLAIVRRIVTAHGGSVTARNNDGPGATFYITLPGGPLPETEQHATPA